MIEFKHLRKEYPNITPLKDVNAIVNDGEVVSVIGPSGTGKSTLLRCLIQLEKPTSGEILVDGVNVLENTKEAKEKRSKMGMVFQSFNLFNHYTVIENLMLPQIEILKKSKQEAYDKSLELLKKVHLEDKVNNYPDQLSGGQKQRIAIARSLALNPEIILFDEPTSALDPTMVGEVLAVIKDIAKNEHKTMFIVTHEMNFAREVSTKVFYMDEGLVYEEGSPKEIFNNPKKPNTKKFMESIKNK